MLKRLQWALRNFFDAIAVVRTRGLHLQIQPNRQKSTHKIIAPGIQQDRKRRGERGRVSRTLVHSCWCVNTDSDTMGAEISFVFEGQENRSHYQHRQPAEGGRREKKKMEGGHCSATGFTFQPERNNTGRGKAVWVGGRRQVRRRRAKVHLCMQRGRLPHKNSSH